jgi:hypothetical protein
MSIASWREGSILEKVAAVAETAWMFMLSIRIDEVVSGLFH